MVRGVRPRGSANGRPVPAQELIAREGLMTMETVAFPLEHGGSVVVRAQPLLPTADESAVVTRGGAVGDAVQRAAVTFEAALSTVGAVADGVLAQLTGLARSPD